MTFEIFCYITDNHNRYSICKKHNIDPVIGTLAYDTKEEVMGWMLDIQLGRRNLSPIQRIKVTEKYRPIYEKQAKKNLEEGGRKGGLSSPNKPLVNLPEASSETKIDVRDKLASIAGVSGKTYSMGKKILDSNNEILKQEVLSGEKSINAGYKELTQDKKTEPSNTNGEINNIPLTTTVTKPLTPKIQISDKVKQICADFRKYRPIYEKQAKKNLVTSTGGHNPQPLPNLVNPEDKVDTTKKLADIAGVEKETYLSYGS